MAIQAIDRAISSLRHHHRPGPIVRELDETVQWVAFRMLWKLMGEPSIPEYGRRAFSGELQEDAPKPDSDKMIEVLEKVKKLVVEFEGIRIFLPDDSHQKIGSTVRKPGDIIPFDRTLLTSGGRPINANFTVDRRHIMTVMPQTDDDKKRFWKMAAEKGVRVIVMLNQDDEGRKPRYLPKEIGASYQFGEFKVTLEMKEGDQIVHSKVAVSEGGGEPVRYDHYHFTSWVNHQPPDEQTFQQLYRLVEEKRGETPVVVHCWSGIGRTGAFVLYDAAIRRPDVPLNKLLLELRHPETGRSESMVGNIAQYYFVAEATGRV